jgi:hypothetical protein
MMTDGLKNKEKEGEVQNGYRWINSKCSRFINTIREYLTYSQFFNSL